MKTMTRSLTKAQEEEAIEAWVRDAIQCPVPINDDLDDEWRTRAFYFIWGYASAKGWTPASQAEEVNQAPP